MEMISVPITFPKDMAPFLERDQAQEFKRNAMILYPYIQDMTISHGRAAEILGVNKLDLIDFYVSPEVVQDVNIILDPEEQIEVFYSNLLDCFGSPADAFDYFSFNHKSYGIRGCEYNPSCWRQTA